MNSFYRNLFLAIFCSITCHAQVAYYQKYAPLGKNESAAVNALMQDQSGYIWIGTNKGLIRFDGQLMRINRACERGRVVVGRRGRGRFERP